jgi:tRNA A37 methylthiotransferase MiaB
MNQFERVAFYTLGCKLNFSETSTIARLFEDGGFAKVDFEDKPDVFVINTCSVTENADKKCKQLVKRGVIKPTDEEAQEMAQEQQNQQPDAQTQFLLAEAQKAQADTGLKAAQTEKTKADTVKTLSDIETGQRQQAIEAVRTMAEIQRTNTQQMQP